MIIDSFMGYVENALTVLFTAATIFSLQSCEPDPWVKVYAPEEKVLQEDRVEYVVNLTGMIGEERGTRSILGSDTEEKPFIRDSGYQVFAFNRRAGVLEAVELVDSHSANATLSLSAVDTYDFFVVGNLWFLDANGSRIGWDIFFNKIDKYPATAEDMKNAEFMPYYRFDGGALGSTGLRTETFAEVATYGIPYSGKVDGVTYENSREGVKVEVRKLFSKVTLTVDHSGLVGSGNVDAFVNESIHLRQVNCRVHPFIEGISAAAEDILADAADYEASPENGASKTFVFYVPENYGGYYPLVMKSSDKVPSVAGDKSGCVTCLEFVGQLKPELAGGYGGTLKYQFCLGENATTSYNVVRNSNYKVTLGFNAGSLFDAASWKLDMGTLTDTRAFGLSADAAGTRRLSEDGTQVIAVRPDNGPSKKREFYVFFNHDGGTSNEVASYVDEYTSGYEPASAMRSAVKISCPDMRADVIKCSYEASTGKVSFWTDSPTALTPGHEYPVTFTLYPGERTVSAKIRTVADLGVTTNFSDMFVGMKRTVATEGFLGSNISLKVVSGGENIFRYSNSAASDGGPGTDSYVTKAGIAFSGMSVPLYAYRPGNVTLAVSSDDSFNDGTFNFDVNVQKPDPRYDDIKMNEPIWDTESGSVVYGSRIMLPFDGTPVDVPAYYCANPWYPESTKISVGEGENQFDFAVYSQLLDFVFAFTSDCVSKDPESLRIYLHHWQVAPNSYFETSLRQSDLDRDSSLLQKVFNNKVMIHPRSTELFDEDDGFEAYVTTRLPGFYDISQREEGAYLGYKKTAWEHVNLTSDYFNYWDSSWDFHSFDEIDDGLILSKWPSVKNRVMFNLMGCNKNNIAVTKHGQLTEYVNTDGDIFSTEANGNSYFEWRFEPSRISDFIADYGTSRAPYGEQYSVLTVTNRWSGEELTIESPHFSLDYGTVKLCTYGIYESGDSEAKLYVGAPLSFAQMLLERAGHALDYSPLINVPFNAFSESKISRTELGAFQPAARETPTNSLEFFAKSSGQWATGNCSSFFAGNSEFIRTNMAACSDGGYGPFEIVTANQFESFTYWDEQSFSAAMEHGWGLPYDYYFFDGSLNYPELPEDLYSNSDLYSVIKFQFDRNGGYEGIQNNTGIRPRRIGWLEM